MNVSDIVVVIPAYNDQEGLETTLRSLDRFGLAMIVAVDDGSDPPLEAPFDIFTPFKLIRHDKNNPTRITTIDIHINFFINPFLFQV